MSTQAQIFSSVYHYITQTSLKLWMSLEFVAFHSTLSDSKNCSILSDMIYLLNYLVYCTTTENTISCSGLSVILGLATLWIKIVENSLGLTTDSLSVHSHSKKAVKQRYRASGLGRIAAFPMKFNFLLFIFWLIFSNSEDYFQLCMEGLFLAVTEVMWWPKSRSPMCRTCTFSLLSYFSSPLTSIFVVVVAVSVLKI